MLFWYHGLISKGQKLSHGIRKSEILSQFFMLLDHCALREWNRSKEINKTLHGQEKFYSYLPFNENWKVIKPDTPTLTHSGKEIKNWYFTPVAKGFDNWTGAILLKIAAMKPISNLLLLE